MDDIKTAKETLFTRIESWGMADMENADESVERWKAIECAVDALIKTVEDDVTEGFNLIARGL